MNYEEKMQDRANADSEFIDFEERCAHCGEMFAYHERTVWYGVVAYPCPNVPGVFVTQEEI